MWSLYKKFPHLTWVRRGLHKINLTQAFPHRIFFYSIYLLEVLLQKIILFCFGAALWQLNKHLCMHFCHKPNFCVHSHSKTFASTSVRKFWIYSRTYHDLWIISHAASLIHAPMMVRFPRRKLIPHFWQTVILFYKTPNIFKPWGRQLFFSPTFSFSESEFIFYSLWVIWRFANSLKKN